MTTYQDTVMHKLCSEIFQLNYLKKLLLDETTKQAVIPLKAGNLTGSSKSSAGFLDSWTKALE